MTNTNLQEELITDVFEWIYVTDNLWHKTTAISIQELDRITDFIETQIALAEKRGEERMKEKCLEVVPEPRKLLSMNWNYVANEIRNSISNLPTL